MVNPSPHEHGDSQSDRPLSLDTPLNELSVESQALYHLLDDKWGKDPRQLVLEQRSLELQVSLLHEVHRFVQQLQSKAPEVRRVMALHQNKLCLNKQQHQRRYNSSTQNFGARVIDRLIHHIGGQARVLSGAFLSLESFNTWYQEKELSDVSAQELFQKKKIASATIEEIISHVDGVLTVINHLRLAVDDFPRWLTDLAARTKQSTQQIESVFDPERKSTPSFEDILMGSMHDPLKDINPRGLYKKNPQLTCFLDQILDEITYQIPVRRPKGKSGEVKKPEFKSTESFQALERYIRDHADGKLLAAVRIGKKLGTEVVDACISLYESFQHCYECYHGSNIERLVEELESVRSGKSVSTGYIQLFRDEMRREVDTILDFDPRLVTADLTSFVTKKRETQKANSQHRTKEAKEYLSLLRELEDFFEDIKMRHASVSSEELFDKLWDFSRRKKEIDRGANLKLSLDTEQDNICFTASDHDGRLEIVRCAVPRVGYNELRGDSWKRIIEKMNILTRYSALSNLYTEMTPRRKVNSNLLLIGPYGCGKNEFTRALLSDPRVVGINMTTERLMTKWFGEAESNVRRLYEAAQKARLAYDKPVVIPWDEFDSLYADGGDGGCDAILTRIQKAMQSVLDGDTVYEGVTTVAMTNQPEKIPVPIYRRFAHVEVIDPLSAEERTSLLKSYLQSVPCADDLNRQFNWVNFEEKTDYMSGDMIGKVFDDVYRGYVDKIEASMGYDALKDINDKAKAVVEEKGKIAASKRAEIFKEVTGGKIVVEPLELERAIWGTLSQDDIKAAIIQQKNFYSTVDTRLAEAFRGDR